MDTLTLLDDGAAIELPARFSGESVRLQPRDMQRALGWELKPEGLCKDALCVPVRNAPELATPDGIDIAALARVLGRPLALDADERVAYLGASAAERGARLATLEAPDFTLPDLSGRRHALSQYRGNKVLLVAYASW